MRSVRPIHSNTLGKILRKHFTGEIPITKPASEQRELISQIKASLEKIPGISMASYYHFPRDKELEERSLLFSLQDESRSFYRSYCSLSLRFDDNGHLMIEHSPHRMKVYQLEQIYSLIDRLKEELHHKKAQAHKTEKINSLKQQAIVAKIKEIAKEDHFDFATTWREYLNKIKILIRLEGGIVLEVDIPYNNFQEILKGLRPLIQNVRDLQKLGITFKIKADAGYSNSGWITHDSL